MKRRSAELKKLISQIEKSDLEKLVLKASQSDKYFHDFLLVNYLNKESGEKELFNDALNDLDILFQKRYVGFTDQLRIANMLTACTKRINEFAKVCRNKNLEADLIVHTLEIPFSYTNRFGTCFSAFDYRSGLLVKRLITLVTKKLHPDYLIEYQDQINEYLRVLHKSSNHLDFIYELPKEI